MGRGIFVRAKRHFDRTCLAIYLGCHLLNRAQRRLSEEPERITVAEAPEFRLGFF